MDEEQEVVVEEEPEVVADDEPEEDGVEVSDAEPIQGSTASVEPQEATAVDPEVEAAKQLIKLYQSDQRFAEKLDAATQAWQQEQFKATVVPPASTVDVDALIPIDEETMGDNELLIARSARKAIGALQAEVETMKKALGSVTARTRSEEIANTISQLTTRFESDFGAKPPAEFASQVQAALANATDIRATAEAAYRYHAFDALKATRKTSAGEKAKTVKRTAIAGVARATGAAPSDTKVDRSDPNWLDKMIRRGIAR